SSNNTFLREIATYDSRYLGYATPDSRPSVAASPDGRFIVAYQRGYADTFTNRTAASDIVVNRYDASGNRLGIQYMGSSSGVNANPSVSMDNCGNPVVVYKSLVGNDFDVKARRVSNSGGLGAEITISASFDDEATPAVALDPTNDKFVVAYTAYVVG